MSLDPSPPKPPPNRLAIGHLLLWTLGSAIVLACYRGLDPTLPNREPLYLVRSLYWLGYGLALGAAVASVLLFAGRRLRGDASFPSQPGHWLLLIRGCTAIVSLAGWGLRTAFERYNEPEYGFLDTIFLVLAFQYLPNNVMACACYWLAWRSQDPADGLWRLTFGCTAAAMGVLALTGGCCLLSGPGPLLPLSLNGLITPIYGLAIIVASLTDPKRRERDFLHWTGVAAVLFVTLLGFSYSYVISYFAA